MADPTATFELLSGTLNIDYIKSAHFRVIHVDGAHGGLRPSGRTIHMALFSERNAIPQHEEYTVADGALGERIRRDGREAIVREVEVDAIMDLDTAKALRDWLTQVVAQAEGVSAEIAKARK
ncbi:MAG TPA: hypothetical protein VHH90_09485 [Polyangia bacterium]|nr:hypothetical protein [Polyangia bacterium]